MSQVTIGFHQSIEVPAFAKSLVGASLSLEESWTVRQLASAIERFCSERGVGVRIGALINAARGAASAPHEPVTSHFASGDRVLIIGDIRHDKWPSVDDIVTKPRASGEPVPITIFTGFLGAGKTTVLNHLLLNQRDKKFAVIENEFGEVPIDNELLQNSALDLAEQVVVMENGCMCCTVRGDLLGAFDAIRKQMDKGSPLDAVLVETTGMADPVPIVRTLRQTPDIARYFRLDGTITLVDTKSILNRLSECEGGKDDQERHRQIAFADKILLNKLDLVDQDQVAEVFKRIRSYNATVPIVSSVKGVVPPAELTNLGAFDMEKIAIEEGAGHGHGHGHEGHGHGHGHDCSDECSGHGEGHGHGDCGDECTEDHGHGGGHGHAHNNSRHDNEIGSFSIVRQNMEVDALAFARWVRIIATLPEEQGKLYRSKGVIAAAGKRAKLIFHAVADVTEMSDGPDWGDHEQRSVKIVFIGKKLDRKKIEERFLLLLQPVATGLRPMLRAPSPSPSPAPTLETLCQRGLLHHALLGLWGRDVLRVSQASATMHDGIFSPDGFAHFRAAAACVLADGAPRGLHAVSGEVWLHALMPLRSIKMYAQAWRAACVKLSTKCTGEYMWGEPLQFDTVGDLEAAGVMWLELGEIKDADTVNFLIEFGWRPETMKSFFDVPGSATNSALVKITVEDPSGDSELDDDLRFRVNLNPENENGEDGEAGGMKLHRMSLQLVGGKTSNHIYQIFFHTVDPAYQVHINVPDHRTPIFPTKEVFHQWHPLMAGLRQRPRLRFLLRLKSLESGPLDAMCGCCG
mmetsp:Transcript_100984/g.290496  ORF Transcript_100984/g.290496 Transcript_100984/m.290496 type:complete len:801 (+) Transcript_100984:99-2501(+)